MLSKRTEINRLNNQSLVRYFDEEWENYNNSRRSSNRLPSLLIILTLDACKENCHFVDSFIGYQPYFGTQIKVQNFPGTYQEISISYLIVGEVEYRVLSAARQLAKTILL
jgi:hypothetical protein